MTETSTSISALPLAAGEWKVDPAHSGIYFKIRHLGLTNVRGMFKSFDATLNVGDTLDSVAVTATIDLASVDTNQPDRDAHLLSTDFFAADKNPQITFTSTGVSGADGEYELAGDLTINGITKAVSFPVEFNGIEVHPGDGKPHAGCTATAVVNRNDFGVDFNMPIGIDKLAMGEKVTVELDLQFVPADPA
ncbi:MAG TPA: YceI family protein [Acidimicrobiales bacterium]|nr:YceI family protein [Acidimicrobiales bacterium]